MGRRRTSSACPAGTGCGQRPRDVSCRHVGHRGGIATGGGMSDQQCLYVGTAGEYSDYRVVGVFSSYENARKNSEVESIFVTTLDEPHKEVGAWKCVMCEAPTTAYFSAPAGKYPKDRLFQPGDIIDTSFEIGVPVEEGPRTAYSKTIQAYGHSEEAAIRAAREYLSVRSTLPWVANAWWPRQQYRTAPIEPLVETAWAHLAPQEGAVQAYGA